MQNCRAGENFAFRHAVPSEKALAFQWSESRTSRVSWPYIRAKSAQYLAMRLLSVAAEPFGER
jgi:hypothetical protein